MPNVGRDKTMTKCCFSAAVWPVAVPDVAEQAQEDAIDRAHHVMHASRLWRAESGDDDAADAAPPLQREGMPESTVR